MAPSQTSKSEKRQVIWGMLRVDRLAGHSRCFRRSLWKSMGVPSVGFAINQKRERTLPGPLLIADRFSLTVISTADFVATTGREE
jgi:hypothetical protein